MLRWPSHVNENCVLSDCDAGDAFWNIRAPRTNFIFCLTTPPVSEFIQRRIAGLLVNTLTGKHVEEGRELP